MKTLKTMSLIGLIWFGICFLCLVSFNNPFDYEAAIGWGLYAVLFGIALAIVGLVKSKK